MSALQAVGAVLIAFAAVKLWIVRRALRERRAFLAGATRRDPAASFAKPWLFAAWIGWRVAAGALALVAGIWLLVR